MDIDLAAAFEHAPAPLLVTTPEGEVLRANEAARRVLAADEDELRRNGFDRRFPREAVSVAYASEEGDQLVVTALRDESVDAAYLDPLTGLASRGLFDEHLRIAIARADRERCALAVLAIDLDGFELLNEKHGLAAGDEVLRRVAQRLQSAARMSDVAARWGGDQFVVLVGDLGRRVCVPAAEGIALRIEDALAEPFELGGDSVACRATVGLAIYPKQVRRAGALIDAALESVAAQRRARRAA